MCKLCEDLQLAYGGGTSILIHHLEAYTRAFGGSSSESKKKQTTLLSFQPKKTCSSTDGKEITRHIANTNVLVPSEEMEKYLRVAPLKSDEDTLDWWKNNAKVFPTFAKLVSVCACYFSSSRKSLFNCWSYYQQTVSEFNIRKCRYMYVNIEKEPVSHQKHCHCYYKLLKHFLLFLTTNI